MTKKRLYSWLSLCVILAGTGWIAWQARAELKYSFMSLMEVGAKWEPVRVVDNDAPPFAQVIVHSWEYVGLVRNRPVVTVRWDGKEVYNGRIPGRRLASQFQGGPATLLIVQTSPGDHVIEIGYEGGRSQKVSVHLEAGGKEHFHLDPEVEGRELIKSLGPNPRFM